MSERTNIDAISMIRLTYVSQLSGSMGGDDLKEILNQARSNNHENGITGMLLFNNRVFLQTIEGSRLRINRLYQKLLNDPRHTNIHLIDVIEINARIWSNWSMGYASPNKSNQSLFLKYSPVATFNPYILSARNAQMLLAELAKGVGEG